MSSSGSWKFAPILIAIIFAKRGNSSENNVCPTFQDYYTMKNNSNCWYDFAAEFDAPEIIKLHGYEFGEYKVTTQDGYILTMFKISSRNINNPITKYYPVFLQHGLLSTGANFIALGKNSLAFMLADSGHDVWLGNYRGNQYSEGHVKYTVNDSAYWDHTMDEMVDYDFPAVFHTILKNSPQGAEIIYIGHSLGTSLALMYSSAYPHEAQRLFKLVILLCPAYTLSNMISPYRILAPFGSRMVDTVELYGLTRLVSEARSIRSFARQFCLESPRTLQLCLQINNLFYGRDTSMGPELGPVYFNQLPGGTAFKVCNHAADLVLGNFRRYNHGFFKNIQRYGTPNPPIYDIKKIRAPIHLVYSTSDWATSERDALNLYNRLPKSVRHGIKRINMKAFNHIDFVFGRNAREIVYEDVLEVIKNAINST